MAAAGYLDYDPATGRYTLPADHVPVLAEEAGPFFFDFSTNFGETYRSLVATSAGFSKVRRVPIDDPFNSVYPQEGVVP
jgi:hypothetical protein